MARKPRAAVAESAAIPDGSELNRALKVVYKPIDWLRPNARNARTHSDGQVQQIVASVLEFGWTNPVLCDETGDVIAGHGRLLAARQMRLADVPCLVLEGLSEAQKSALRIADNRIALSAGWDDDMLRLELTSLSEGGFNLALTGFSGDELGDLLAMDGDEHSDPDDVPDVQPDPVTMAGDVWILGRHRVMCGDSTNATDVAQLMAGKLASLCFTSPPYAQQRDYASGGIGDWDKLMQGVFSVLPVSHQAQVLVNLGMVHRSGEWVPYWDGWIDWMRAAGWRRFGWYVWDQGFGLPGDWSGRFAPSHEFVFHFDRPEGESEASHSFVFHMNKTAVAPNKTHDKKPENIKTRRAGESTMRGKDGKLKAFSSPQASAQRKRIPASVVRVTRQVGKVGPGLDHPAVFPVDLPGEFINAYTQPGDLVFEPFCGSGTQLIAAQKNGRSCCAMEIAALYADVAVRRWQNFTGQKATLENDGRTFSEIEAERVLARV